MNDIIAEIQVTEIVSPKRAVAKILGQKTDRPIAAGDVLDLPVYRDSMGVTIALAGSIRADGLTEKQFTRIVKAARASVVIQVDHNGQYLDAAGARISTEKAMSMVTSRVKYLVIGDADGSGADAEEHEDRPEHFREQCEILRTRAAAMKIEEITLEEFLKKIGYLPRQVIWGPGVPLSAPAGKTNGLRSPPER